MILKKLISIVASAVMCLVSINSVYAFEASDDPSISICKTEFNDLYEIEYPKVEKDKINSSYEKDVKNARIASRVHYKIKASHNLLQ